MADIIDFKTKKIVTAIKQENPDFSLIDFYLIDPAVDTYSFRANEATRNVLITGETGIGKTTSTILPIVDSLIKNDCPGLILDIKSDLYPSVLALAERNNKQDRVILIGTHSFCEDINILASIKTIEQFKNILTSIKPYTSEQNSYWFYSGLTDVLDIVSIHKWYTEEIENQEYSFDITEVNKYIIDLNYTTEIVDLANRKKSIAPIEILRTIQKVMKEPFSLYNSGDEDFNEDVANQRMWRSGQISTILTELVKEPFLNKLFNADNKKSIHDYIYKEGKVIVLSVPLEHEGTGYYAAKLLREVFFKAVCQNEIEDLGKYKIGKDFNRYTFLAIDEYQFYINDQNINGVITDENWLSISRGYGNINVFATQSISSIVSKVGVFSSETILQNFANQIFLKTSDLATYNHANFLVGDVIPVEIIRRPKPNQRIGIYKLSSNGGVEIDGFNSLRNPVASYINSEEFKALKKSKLESLKSIQKKSKEEESISFMVKEYGVTTITLTNGKKINSSKFIETELYRKIKGSLLDNPTRLNNWDNRWIDNFLCTPFNITFNEESIKEIYKLGEDILSFDNKYQTIGSLYFLQKFRELMDNDGFSDEDIENTISLMDGKLNRYGNPKIVLITHKNSKGMTDFLETLNYKAEVIYIDDLHMTFKNKEKRESQAGKAIMATIKSAEMICMARGGGDLSHKSFDYYRTPNLVKAIKQLNPECPILTGIGHSTDVFIADLYADTASITPTALANYINELLNSYYKMIRAYDSKKSKAEEKPKSSLKQKIASIFRRHWKQIIIYYNVIRQLHIMVWKEITLMT